MAIGRHIHVINLVRAACVAGVALAASVRPAWSVAPVAAILAGAPEVAVVHESATAARVIRGVADTLRVPGGLMPGDLIRLRIWREQDLSGEFPVDADGVVILPKIGAQQVMGESREALRERLMRLYGEYLRNPSIEVTFLRRINVLGSVREPGLIVVDPTMVVADAIALAGGVMFEGRTDRIRLIRGGEVLTADISQRTRIADLPLQSGDQLYVPEKGWFSRNSVGTTFVSAGLGLLSVLITIALTK